jgi:hypothetical protein
MKKRAKKYAIVASKNARILSAESKVFKVYTKKEAIEIYQMLIPNWRKVNIYRIVVMGGKEMFAEEIKVELVITGLRRKY